VQVEALSDQLAAAKSQLQRQEAGGDMESGMMDMALFRARSGAVAMSARKLQFAQVASAPSSGAGAGGAAAPARPKSLSGSGGAPNFAQQRMRRSSSVRGRNSSGASLLPTETGASGSAAGAGSADGIQMNPMLRKKSTEGPAPPEV
jgi:hypothetical protein